MSQLMSVPCQHELRPGIKVCLHCARDARMAARARRLKVLKHSALALLAILAVGSLTGTGTLATVFGPPADSLLSTIPRGSLVQVQDLFAELPTRGLRIALPAGGAITLWPEPWERADGPLVIAYRTTVTR